MSILSKVTTGRVARPQKIVIYAPEGFGKSTLASQFPTPLFLDVEDSTAQMDVTRLGREDLPGLKQVEQAITAVLSEKPCETLVIDTADWLEQMVVDQMIKDAANDKIQGIEDFGYGKGYTELRERVTLLLAKLDMVVQAGMNVVFLAHSQVKKHEPPDGAGPFDRYELKLSKQVAPLLKEWADMVLFGNWRLQVKEKDKNEAGQKFKAVGGRERLMHCNRTAAWDAKNRHGLADSEKWEIATVQRAFSNVGAPWGALKPAAPKPAEDTRKPVKADDAIPDIDVPEKPDPELEAIVGANEEYVNAYLLSVQKIEHDQTFRSVPADYRKRILGNPKGFLDRVAAHAKGKEVA
jgi:hypothetical protein